MESSPVLVFISRALVKFAAERSAPVRTDDSRLAPLRSEKGPIMYPPLALFVINL
jgi:hypothetical protein